MPSAISTKTDYSAAELRRLAAWSKHANQSRRLLLLAAVLDGASREDAARIGGMDRQTLRDWVHRFNADGPDGSKDILSKGQPARARQVDGAGRDRRDRPGSRDRWRRALATHRS